jgi:predicted metal-binding membrane protein
MRGIRSNVDSSDKKVRPGSVERGSQTSSGRSAPTRPPYEAAPVAILLGLSVLAWLVSSQVAGREMRIGLVTGTERSMDGMDPTRMAMSFPLFMASWVVPMVAVMFPGVTPVVLTFRRWLSSREDVGRRTVSLVAGYLIVWSTIGVAAYALLQVLQNQLPAGSSGAVRIAAILLVVAGGYQLTPLKNACLRHCRSPLSILVEHATLLSHGSVGAFRVGLKHGRYCIGCCWSLMLVLLLLGMMNLVWMGMVAAIIFSEKALPHGALLSRVVGVSLVAIGIAGVIAPDTVSAIT